jgi:hypothetical protein
MNPWRPIRAPAPCRCQTPTVCYRDGCIAMASSELVQSTLAGWVDRRSIVRGNVGSRATTGVLWRSGARWRARLWMPMIRTMPLFFRRDMEGAKLDVDDFSAAPRRTRARANLSANAAMSNHPSRLGSTMVLAGRRGSSFHKCARPHAPGFRTSAHAGSSIWKVDPFPSVDSTQMRPPCISTICLAMASPRPVPPLALVLELST